MKTIEDIKIQMAEDSGYQDYDSFINEVSGDSDLVDFYLGVFALMVVEEYDLIK